MKGFINFEIHQILLFRVSGSIIARTPVSILFNVLHNNVTKKRSSQWAAKLSQTRLVNFIQIANNILRCYFFIMQPIVVNNAIVESCTSCEDNTRSQQLCFQWLANYSPFHWILAKCLFNPNSQPVDWESGCCYCVQALAWVTQRTVSTYDPIKCKHYRRQRKIPVAEHRPISAIWSIREPSNKEKLAGAATAKYKNFPW